MGENLTNLDWLVENERDFVVDTVSMERCCRYCAFDDECDALDANIAKCMRGNREWLLSPHVNEDAKTNMDFVVYAGKVAKGLYDEAFALLEGCDEPYFSAIDAICGLSMDMMQIANQWQRLDNKKAVE